nr:hypothetical protein [Tanacetum cinerariifolium]
MRDGRRDNPDLQIYRKDDTPMCEPYEANYEFVYKPLSNRIENDKGDVKAIEEDETHPIPTMPNLNLVNSNSPTVSPFLKDCIVHILYTNAKTFADDKLLSHVGDEEFKSVGNGEARCLEEKSIDLTRLCQHFRSIYHIEIDHDFSCPDSLPRNTHTKLRHEFVYKPLSNRIENDKGDVKAIEEDETHPIPTMPNLNLVNSNSPTVSPFLKDCIVHILYTNAKTFADDKLLSHVGDEEFKSVGGIENEVFKKKKEE